VANHLTTETTWLHAPRLACSVLQRASRSAARPSAPDREQLKRDLSDALSAIQQDQGVLGQDELAASLTTLGLTYTFHGR
jgi:hypothetical protein